MAINRLDVVLLAVLAVLALGLAAATVDVGDLPDGDRERENLSQPPSAPRPGGGGGVNVSSLHFVQCPTALDDARTTTGVAAALVVLGGALYRRRRSVVLPVVAVAPPVVGLLSLCPSLLGAVPTPSSQFALAPEMLIGGLFVAVAGALALFYVQTGAGVFPEDDRETGADLAAVGAAAGAAADRIEGDAAVSNEVYRAWLEMTRHLDVENPASTAPDEFADAAVEAGMADADVEVLTRLFQEVRYGGRDPETRTDEAVAALRRIERTYPEVDS